MMARCLAFLPGRRLWRLSLGLGSVWICGGDEYDGVAVAQLAVKHSTPTHFKGIVNARADT
jgi:hypothetical protein